VRRQERRWCREAMLRWSPVATADIYRPHAPGTPDESVSMVSGFRWVRSESFEAPRNLCSIPFWCSIRRSEQLPGDGGSGLFENQASLHGHADVVAPASRSRHARRSHHSRSVRRRAPSTDPTVQDANSLTASMHGSIPYFVYLK
jgi:hypothetical protein